MKAQINETGYLFVERAGSMKVQGCPFSNDECGDWCPLFEEYKFECYTTDDKPKLIHHDLQVLLRCSVNGQYFSPVEDFRGKQ